MTPELRKLYYEYQRKLDSRLLLFGEAFMVGSRFVDIDPCAHRLRPIGSEVIYDDVVYRIVAHVHGSRVQNGQDIYLPADDPDARERLEPVGRVADGEKRYFDGHCEAIRDWQI